MGDRFRHAMSNKFALRETEQRLHNAQCVCRDLDESRGVAVNFMWFDSHDRASSSTMAGDAFDPWYDSAGFEFDYDPELEIDPGPASRPPDRRRPEGGRVRGQVGRDPVVLAPSLPSACSVASATSTPTISPPTAPGCSNSITDRFRSGCRPSPIRVRHALVPI